MFVDSYRNYSFVDFFAKSSSPRLTITFSSRCDDSVAINSPRNTWSGEEVVSEKNSNIASSVSLRDISKHFFTFRIKYEINDILACSLIKRRNCVDEVFFIEDLIIASPCRLISQRLVIDKEHLYINGACRRELFAVKTLDRDKSNTSSVTKCDGGYATCESFLT